MGAHSDAQSVVCKERESRAAAVFGSAHVLSECVVVAARSLLRRTATGDEK
jgi:hypothetical protein